jgi:molybdopterin converting factor small subunit
MFPSPRIYTAERESTLREFIAGLGREFLYAYEQRVIIVLVNGQRRWPSSRVNPGDRVAVLPIIAGG